MPSKYSCFISYRHPEYPINQRIVKELYEGLCAELEMFTNKPVYIDTNGLTGGHMYNEKLSLDLFNSVCLIVIYTPTYFSLDHTYCAREFKAMEELETCRLDMLSDPTEKTNGLIIPIVFRGFDRIPNHIKSKRYCYDFSSFLGGDEILYQHHKFAPEIKSIAQYIADRCNIFDQISPDPWEDKGVEFTLPLEGIIKPWIESMIPLPLKLPGR